MSNPFHYAKPVVPELTQEQRDAAVFHTLFGFTFSRRDSHGYRFSLSNVFGAPTQINIRYFNNLLAEHLRNVATFAGNDPHANEPTLAYLCSDDEGGASNIHEVRLSLAERLGWRSVLVHPNKALLRERIAGVGSATEARTILAGRPCIILAETSRTGAAIAQAAGVLAAFNTRACSALTIYDPQEGAEESLATMGLPLYALFNRTDVEGRNSLLARGMKKCSRPFSVSDLSGVAALAAA